MSEDNAISAAKPDKDWLGWLKRATQARVCFLVISVVLAADIALVVTSNPNLLRLDWARFSTQLDPGVVAVLVAIYLAYMAALSPGLQLVIEGLVKAFPCRFAEAPDNAERPTEHAPSATHVRSKALRGRALEDQSEFLLKIVAEHEAHRSHRRSETEALADVAFACLGLSLMACWLDTSVLRQLAFSQWEVALAMPAFFATAWWMHVNALAFDDDWIYYPPLAKEFANQRHERHGHAYLRKQAAQSHKWG